MKEISRKDLLACICDLAIGAEKHAKSVLRNAQLHDPGWDGDDWRNWLSTEYKQHVETIKYARKKGKV